MPFEGALKADEVNDWLGVITNIGVIVGLVFVVYEVRQTNEALDRENREFEVSNIQNSRENLKDFYYSLINNGEVASIWQRGCAGEELSPGSVPIRPIGDAPVPL